MNSLKLPEGFESLGENAEFVFLSTINKEGFPETRAMLNLRNTKMFPGLKQYFSGNLISFFTTNTSSKKVTHIFRDNKASVYYVNGKTFEGLLLTGTVEIVKDSALKKDLWQENWTMYYSKDVDDPDYALLKFVPSQYKYYNGNFEVSSGSLKQI